MGIYILPGVCDDVHRKLCFYYAAWKGFVKVYAKRKTIHTTNIVSLNPTLSP